MNALFEIREYVEDERSPFAGWFDGLDSVTAARVDRYIRRLESGNFGAAKALREGGSELRLDFGPGCRVYFGRDGKTIILLLGGIRVFMKLETIQMLKRPRWLLFYISLGMVAAGYCGFRLFEYTSSISHDHFGLNDSDVFAALCFFLALVGVLLCALSCTWIIISAALFYVRRFESKQPHPH